MAFSIGKFFSKDNAASSRSVEFRKLTMDEFIDTFADIISKIAYTDTPIDKNMSFVYISPSNPFLEEGKRIGNLPKDFSAIIKASGISIPEDKVNRWIDTGTEGVIFAENSDYEDCIGVFSREDGIVGIINLHEVKDDEKFTKLAEKVFRPLENVQLIVQKKIEEVFPELKE